MSECKCKCDLRTKLVGDGCDACNPAKALEFAKGTIEDQAEQIKVLDGIANELQDTCHKQAKMLAEANRAADSATHSVELLQEQINVLKAELAQLKRPDMVLVPRDVIKSAKNLLEVKGRHHTELAYKQLCQSLINAEEMK